MLKIKRNPQICQCTEQHAAPEKQTRLPLHNYLEMETQHLFKWQARCIANGWRKGPDNRFHKMTCKCGNTLNMFHIATCTQQRHTFKAMGQDIGEPNWWRKSLDMVDKRYAATKDMVADSTLLRVVIDSYLLHTQGIKVNTET